MHAVLHVLAPIVGIIAAAQAHYSLPELSGPHCVGKTIPLVLTDHARNDVFYTNSTTARQILLHVYYPTARLSPACPGDNYATPGFADWISNFLGGNVPASYFRKFKTHSIIGAPLKHTEKDNQLPPLLLFSHGLKVPAKLNQAIVEDVASHGYVVILVEHPWDSDYAEFPDGRVIKASPRLGTLLPGTPVITQDVDVRTADILFTLESVKRGKVKVSGCSLASLADRVGMFGHSLGGQLSLVAMLQTPKIIAGSNMDGWFSNGANATNLTDPSDADARRPFFNLRADPANIPEELRWAGGGVENEIAAMKVQTGPKVQPIIAGSSHYSFSDLTQLSIPAHDVNMPKEKKTFQDWIGTINPTRMHKINAEYHKWFFDITMKGKGDPGDINRGLSYPEVTFEDIGSL
ncbi:hypothetical protein TWF730_004485 [Orbilia blumenaviensis]|uniref:1-alkyl-2-acetylglycerophosphocholine esterase n=1 Tax=Orbilia blumenaviensis TaxID=1796055 RepID=A0AAV9U025_9PEZI